MTDKTSKLGSSFSGTPDKSYMLDSSDPAAAEIVRRAKSLMIGSNPDTPSHKLGKVTLANGEEVNAHVVHAVDSVVTDGRYVAMIDRLKDPGKGKPALPGGFIDPAKNGAAETSQIAAARETHEEINLALNPVSGILVGSRLIDRPQEIRIADFSHIDDPAKRAAKQAEFKEKYDIEPGDVLLVSTQAVLFYVPDLQHANPKAGDDAAPGSAKLVEMSKLTEDYVGIPDHAGLIHTANQVLRGIVQSDPARLTQHLTQKPPSCG